MQEITIDQAREKARSWLTKGKNWHFHVLFPDCVFNTQSNQFALVLENRTADQTFAVYSDNGFAKISQEFLKLRYGDSILETQAGVVPQEKPANTLLTQCEVFKQNKVLWHHHLLFPDCIFNQHPGKWNIVLEGSGEARTFNALYDEEPMDDFRQLEIEYFKEIDPTFCVEAQGKETRNLQLKDRVAIVTGSGQGIGRAIALRLARAGAKVVVADLHADTARQTVQVIEAGGGEAVDLVADVTNRSDAVALTQKAIEAFGGLDILVNNAGFYPSALVIEIDEADWDLVLAVNLKGTFLCSQAAAKQMMTRRRGVIINIASVDGKMRTTGNAHYAAAKAGVISFTRTLACEMAPYNIRVNAVSPGWIATEIMKAKSERWRHAIEEIPVGRLGTPEDVAEAVLFLVSDAAGYITGEILDVNGGIVMD